MTIVDEYARQRKWRSWQIVIDALPDLNQACVLDLGCGIGDLAADLSARGARVIGVDSNPAVVQLIPDGPLMSKNHRSRFLGRRAMFRPRACVTEPRDLRGVMTGMPGVVVERRPQIDGFTTLSMNESPREIVGGHRFQRPAWVLWRC